MNKPSSSGFLPSALAPVFRTSDALSPVLLRLALAIVVFPHGAQKMLGWFGGFGFQGTMGFFTEKMGILWLLALGVILVEFFAPLFLLAGLLTRPAAAAIAIVLGTAMVLVHLPNGFFMNWMGNQKGEGIEYFLLVFGIVGSLIVSGAGRWSLDRLLARG